MDLRDVLFRRRRATTYSPSAGLPFDSTAFESNIAWIFGSPRTGSTWLMRMLCHPLQIRTDSPLGFAAPRRFDRVLDIIPVNESYFPKHLAPQLGIYRAPGELNPLLPRTLNEEMSSNPSYLFSPQYQEQWGPEMRRLMLVRLHGILERAVADGLGTVPNPVFVIKEVNGSHATDLVMSLMTGAKLIFLVRDGRDVVDSMLHAYRPEGWVARGKPAEKMLASPDRRMFGVTAFSRQWVGTMTATRRAFDAHDRARRHLLRYEDLRSDPAPELRRLFEWLRLDRGPEDIRAAIDANLFENVPDERKGPSEPFRAATPGLWRENFNDEEAAKTWEIMGETLHEYGYER